MNVFLALLFFAQAATGEAPGLPSAPAPAAVQPSVVAAPTTVPSAAVDAAGQAVVAQATDAAAGPQKQGWWQTLIFFGVMILVFWLLIIRPQQKQRKKQETFLSSLNPGDKVVTSAGMIGRIVTIAQDVVTVELAKDVRIRVVKGHITGHYQEPGETKAV